ncbi:MAG: phosphatase [endosymbiont of Galathealinum brachiosum]|uniref:Phosphatase n=1 Tax=endosymbiont of Galathealinum brachiosum TaxID=2200906 RepID=A0A370DME4_9GAMM|nr:MAG: phosphatase [endosymbiont of Galathealinum brachiosum]
MHKTEHAQKITDRFRDLVQQTGDSLSVEHYDELTLLIEAGIDTALVEHLEKMADKLQKLSNEVRKDAEYFD